MKKKIKYVLVILMFLCVFLTGCSKLSVVQEYVYNDSNYEIGNKAFNDEIETIEIDWIVGNINIIQSTNHELIIREEIDLEIDDKYKMHYKLDETKLDIKFSASTNFLNYNFKTKNLYVFLLNAFLFVGFSAIATTTTTVLATTAITTTATFIFCFFYCV